MEMGKCREPRRLPTTGNNATPDPAADGFQIGLWILHRKRDILHCSRPLFEFGVSVLAKCGLIPRTIAFVVGFSTFLIACIDWSKIRGSHTLNEIIIPHGLSRYIFE